MIKRHALVSMAIVSGVLAGHAAAADPIARNHPNNQPVDRKESVSQESSGPWRPTMCCPMPSANSSRSRRQTQAAAARRNTTTTQIGIERNARVLQANGAIIVTGEPFGTFAGSDHTDLVRYNLDGSLDVSFDADGKLTLSGARVDEGLALQSNGRLVLAGSATAGTTTAPTSRFVLVRLIPTAAQTLRVGTAGTADTAFAVNAAANALALQGDGKIVAVGLSMFSVNSNFVVARYKANGAVDRTFGSDGNMSIDFFGFTDIGESVAVQPDGKIVLGGLARDDVDGYGVARVPP